MDYSCHSQRLIIEVDGDSHIDKQEYDAVRDDFLKQLNLCIVRLPTRQITDSIAHALQNIVLNIEQA